MLFFSFRLATQLFLGSLKDGLGQRVMAGDVAKPAKLASLHCYQWGFLGASQVLGLVADELIRFVLEVGDTEQPS